MDINYTRFKYDDNSINKINKKRKDKKDKLKNKKDKDRKEKKRNDERKRIKELREISLSRYSNQQIGKIAEIKTIEKFLSNGINVYIPYIDTGVDMIADFDNKLQKIQVKSSRQIKGVQSHITVFPALKNNQLMKDGKLTNVRQKYEPGEIDYFSFYDSINDNISLIKATDIHTREVSIYNRLPDSSQCTAKNILFIEDCNIDKVLDDITHHVVVTVKSEDV